MSNDLKTEAQRNLKAALDRLTYRQTWTLCVEALRTMRRSGDKASTVRWHVRSLEHVLYPLMRKQLDLGNIPLEPLESSLDALHATNVLEFLLWLERAGLSYHLGRGTDEYTRFSRFLPAGLKFFDAGSDDESPYAHDWTARLQKQCGGLTDEIVALLDDALSCFDHRLLRPAVGLLGVAFEAAFFEVYVVLRDTYNVPMVPSKPEKAKHYIDAVRSAVNVRIQSGDPDSGERRAAAQKACNFADDLRELRNKASHPLGAKFEDPDQVDELFIEAARKLPPLWLLR